MAFIWPQSLLPLSPPWGPQMEEYHRLDGIPLPHSMTSDPNQSQAEQGEEKNAHLEQ